MAAHPSFDRAVRSAWHELVERYGFMSLWLGRSSTRQLRIPPVSRAGELLSAVRADGAQVVLHDISNHGVTAVLAAMRTPSHALALGAAAGNPESAPWKALIEAATSIARWRDRDPPMISREAVQRPEDHEALYLTRSAPLEAVEYLFDDHTVVDIDDIVDGCRVEDAEFPDDLVVCDLSSDLTAPLQVARCLCPVLLPITFGYDMEPLGLWGDAPDEILCDRARGTLIPHPFA